MLDFCRIERERHPWHWQLTTDVISMESFLFYLFKNFPVSKSSIAQISISDICNCFPIFLSSLITFCTRELPCRLTKLLDKFVNSIYRSLLYVTNTFSERLLGRCNDFLYPSNDCTNYVHEFRVSPSVRAIIVF